MYSFILKLAYKNAFFRLPRTLLIICMIAVSMSMMISIEALYDGMALSMLESNKRSDSGEISIYAPKYRLEKSPKESIKNATEIEKSLKKRADVSSVALRFRVDGLSATAKKSSLATMIGINLEDEEQFGKISQSLKRGELLLDKRGVLLGKKLFQRLKLKIGSKVIFSTQDIHGEINSMALRVRGVLQTNNIALDSFAMYVEINRVRKFLGIDAQEATQIAIRTDSKTLQAELQKEYKTLDVQSFSELYPMVQEMLDLTDIFNSITFFIVMFVVFIGIMGVMYVSILDRIREFGIMKSVGLSYGLIRLQIFLEALVLGLFGYALGAVFGLLALFYLQYIGLDLSEFSDGMENFGISSIIYAEIQMNYFIETFLAITTASLLSVLLPLKKIKEMHTADVIKVEI